MQRGKRVVLVRNGHAVGAEVLDVLDGGPSGYKRLALRVGGKAIAGPVSHKRDAARGKPYWVEPHDRHEHAVSDDSDEIAHSPAVPEPTGLGHATAGESGTGG